MKWQNAVSFADRCLNFTARVDVLEAWRMPCYDGANRKAAWCIRCIVHVPKNEKENLSMAERKALKKRADSIFETYGR
jgi:hypothetical protein